MAMICLLSPLFSLLDSHQPPSCGFFPSFSPVTVKIVGFRKSISSGSAPTTRDGLEEAPGSRGKKWKRKKGEKTALAKLSPLYYALLEPSWSSFRTIMETFYATKATLSEHAPRRSVSLETVQEERGSGGPSPRRNYLRDTKHSRRKIIGTRGSTRFLTPAENWYECVWRLSRH